jgi:lysophospholipase L1-like esterase
MAVFTIFLVIETVINTVSILIATCKSLGSCKIRFVNTGISGQTTSQIIADVTRATNQITYGGTFTNKVCVVQSGANDIISSGDSAATIYNNLKTLWAALKPSYNKVIGWTLLRAPYWSAPQLVVVDALNALILGSAPGTDAILDVNTLGLTSGGGDYFSDNLHPSASGNTKISTAMKTVLDTLI